MSRPLRARLAVLLVGGALAVSLSACGGDAATDAGPTGSATTGPATPTAAMTYDPEPETEPTGDGPVPTGPPSGPPVEVTVTRSGGIAGVTQTLVVRPDGRWEYRDGRGAAAKVSRGELAQPVAQELFGLVASPALAAEAGTPAAGCADGFRYELAAGSKTIQWMECGVAGPETAQSVVQLLARETGL